KPQFLTVLRGLYAAFPDWHYDHDPPVGGAGCYTVRWRQGGTHTGTFAFPGSAPIPATGKKVQIPEQAFHYEIRDDKIIRIEPGAVPGGAPGGIRAQLENIP